MPARFFLDLIQACGRYDRRWVECADVNLLPESMDMDASGVGCMEHGLRSGGLVDS